MKGRAACTWARAPTRAGLASTPSAPSQPAGCRLPARRAGKGRQDQTSAGGGGAAAAHGKETGAARGLLTTGLTGERSREDGAPCSGAGAPTGLRGARPRQQEPSAEKPRGCGTPTLVFNLTMLAARSAPSSRHGDSTRDGVPRLMTTCTHAHACRETHSQERSVRSEMMGNTPNIQPQRRGLQTREPIELRNLPRR